MQFLSHYLFWHYSRALRDAWGVWKNFFRLAFSFFSVRALLTTLFSPWKRLHEEPTKWSLEAFVDALIVNVLMRIVGVLIRLVTLAMYVVVFALLAILGILFYIVWFCVPFLIIFSIIFSVMLFS